MLGSRMAIRRKNKDEEEKPFWISFADLMSGLMVLFLLVMSVALLAVTKTVSEAERKKIHRDQAIEKIMLSLDQASKAYPGITIDKQRQSIDYGDKARFDSGSSKLSTTQADQLIGFVPEILNIANQEAGKTWLKRIIVEGFADQRGDYLLNLNLSLQRSQRVLCILLENNSTNTKLTIAQREQIKDMFLVGGYSFNSSKKTLEESRRIEFRLEFYGLEEAHPKKENIDTEYGTCRI